MAAIAGSIGPRRALGASMLATLIALVAGASPVAGSAPASADRAQAATRPLAPPRALTAIDRELARQADRRTQEGGHTFYPLRRDCERLSRRKIRCAAFIIEFMGYECQFAGHLNRRWSADEAWVKAIKRRGRRGVATRFGYTGRRYYCYG